MDVHRTFQLFNKTNLRLRLLLANVLAQGNNLDEMSQAKLAKQLKTRDCCIHFLKEACFHHNILDQAAFPAKRVQNEERQTVFTSLMLSAQTHSKLMDNVFPDVWVQSPLMAT